MEVLKTVIRGQPGIDHTYIHIYIYITSSTAQGGGGSFKDRTL